MRRRSNRRRSQQAGFTLIEIMFVVAIIAVLAAIAVPLFTEETRKGKANSEVAAMFAEMAMRLEQFRVDGTGYPATSARCPAAPDSAGQDISACTSGAWNGLKIRLPSTTAFCSYRIHSGTASGTANLTTSLGGLVFTFTQPSPAGPWYILEAVCDQDADGTAYSGFVTASFDNTIHKLNEGE